MNKIIMTTLLLCMGLIIASCEKTYSVEEFKKNEELRNEWLSRCGLGGGPKNCQNARLAADELRKEYYDNLSKQLLESSEKRRKAMEQKKEPNNE
ncbi:EexN family lipoprotein [Bartonella sp. WD12.1]|uniref:EexN family lipoprotein n=1 Tax=Bartonella sp. WD12.1 TaxID=1933903 RepID=UPI00099AC3F9|nr:EexN family lipoprotein [Bartonella sp. WD12.1]OPB28406.1 hypothetical protein BWD121_016740 [Bartonella sp. WD12.1]